MVFNMKLYCCELNYFNNFFKIFEVKVKILLNDKRWWNLIDVVFFFKKVIGKWILKIINMYNLCFGGYELRYK